jgi:hypothetical protein
MRQVAGVVERRVAMRDLETPAPMPQDAECS